MAKYIIPLSYLLFFSISLFAQPQPCVNPAMTAFCEDACVICDIDGFTGINDNPETGAAPGDFCTTQVHHMSWIAFIAGSENLTIAVDVSNCSIFWGLEIGIYESLDCETFQQVTECDTDVAEGETAVFTNTEPLVVGQYYYFVMDGSGGAICNYTITVLDGTTEVGVLEPIMGIDGPDVFCPNTLQAFTVPGVPGANFSQWRVNGILVDDTHETLEYEFQNDGVYDICYMAFNVCDTIPTVCKTVIVESLPPFLFDEVICDGDSLVVFDTAFFETGIYNYSFLDQDGCLQEVSGTLEVLPTVYTNLELTFCFGDSVFFGGGAFTETGFYEVPLIASTQCDSILLLDLNTFLCDIDGGFADDDLLCNGDNNGQLVFNLVDGVSPYEFSWEEETGTNLTGSGVSDLNSPTITISDLVAGVYSITIMDAAGSAGIFVGQVFEPFSVAADIEKSEFAAYNISCYDGTDGSLTVTPTIGVSPFSYNWSNGNQQDFNNNLSEGDYAVTVTDANGCTLVLESILTEPEPVYASFDLTQPHCNPHNSGIIQVDSTSGGTSPYLYSLEGGNLMGTNTFSDLFTGFYTVRVEDVFGCVYEETLEMREPNTLVLELEAQLELCLGDSLQLKPNVNHQDVSFTWTSLGTLSCDDCPRPYIRPFTPTSYQVTATLPNGCERVDSIDISIVSLKKLYVPNVFSPNGDGINDEFRIYSSKEVSRILEFEIFNRWGGLVASFENLPPHLGVLGWNGEFNQEPVDEGIYVWRAVVEFLDGVVLDYKGDVMVVK